MRPRPKPAGWRRHLDGWQAGLIVVVLAGGAILLAVPRAVPPQEVPIPAIDRAALRQARQDDQTRAARARAQELPFDVRALGKAYRRYNEVIAKADMEHLPTMRYTVADAARKALAAGPEPVLDLRSYQSEQFLKELHAWEESGEPSDELIALSGDFIGAIQRNQWCREEGGERKLALSDDVLRILFKRRWNQVAGLTDPAFALSANEDRLRHTFLLRNPFRKLTDTVPGVGRTEQVAAKRRLASIDRIAQLDDTYPADLARGVVYFQAGSYGRASAAFRTFLDRPGTGEHRLRAQYYLKAALDKGNETGRL